MNAGRAPTPCPRCSGPKAPFAVYCPGCSSLSEAVAERAPALAVALREAIARAERAEAGLATVATLDKDAYVYGARARGGWQLVAMHDPTGRRGLWYRDADGAVELAAGREGDDCHATFRGDAAEALRETLSCAAWAVDLRDDALEEARARADRAEMRLAAWALSEAFGALDFDRTSEGYLYAEPCRCGHKRDEHFACLAECDACGCGAFARTDP